MDTPTHKTREARKEVGDESSIVGRLKLPPSEAHEDTSPLKSFKEAPISLKTTNPPTKPKKRKLEESCQSLRKEIPKC